MTRGWRVTYIVEDVMGIVRFHTNEEASRILGHSAGCGDCYWSGDQGACDSAECDGGIFMESTGPNFERAPTGDLVHLKRASDYRVEVLDSRPLDKQEGGSHYKNFAIQPAVFIQRNKLSWCEGNVVKYVCRHNFKNGKEDLLKAKHYIDLLLQMQYEDDGV